MLPDDQVHPDTHVLTMVNNVTGVINYVIAARPSLLNFVIADSTRSFNRRTCLGKITQPGTYRIFGGTGHYAGIRGHGKFVVSILLIGAKSGGKCTQRKPPVAFQQVIRASGPVTL